MPQWWGVLPQLAPPSTVVKREEYFWTFLMSKSIVRLAAGLMRVMA